ncbi:unnamed protein product [Prorocentrum cordatum]|uniref:Uncharacterized protein n=2 Tax=Prorocentrum cordatum TaxID=2364126 RepID=A0ABN9Y4V0_9DINO|nr:unnamed protein product [Polarella glacialis]
MHVLTVSHSCLILQQGPTPLLERMRLRNDRYAWTCGKTHAEREAQQAGENRARSGAPLGDRAGGRRQRAHAAWGRRGASEVPTLHGRWIVALSCLGAKAETSTDIPQSRRVDTETTEVQMQKKTGGS